MPRKRDLPDGISLTDGEGKITFANRAFVALSVKNQEENVHGEIVENCFDLQRTSPESPLLKKNTMGRSVVAEFSRQNGGGERHLRLARHPIRSSNRESLSGHIWSARDVTQNKLAAKMRDEFLDVATHELRTPLANIKAYAETLALGGLIQERDGNTQNKLPHFGDLKFIGSLFQRRAINKERKEIIFFLVPHIVPYRSPVDCQEQTAAMRAQTPIFQHGLQRTPRPWAPRMPDCIKNPVPWNQFHPATSPVPAWHQQHSNVPGGIELLPTGTPVTAPLLDSQSRHLRVYTPHIVRLPPTRRRTGSTR